MFFWWICGGEIGLPILSLRHLWTTLRMLAIWSLGWKISWRRAWQPIPDFLPGESYGQKRLMIASQRVGHDWNDLACMQISFRLIKKENSRGRSQDGGGVGRGEHFLPHKFIERTFKCRVNSTKQLLNAGRGHQAARKSTQLFKRR